jgi:hypothetical protein
MNSLFILKYISYLCKTNKKQIETMKGVIKIGKITKDQILTVYKKASREMELENSTGWVAKHKVHKSAKDYNRNPKHKALAY